ncbi:hypothetical protein [Litchfieldella rifensis]|uniref:Uncharacterized protein n=1 Tax=Litchfieldella rifensis TaxID=762643 RepID=A0ABV7LJ58_9GAMM
MDPMPVPANHSTQESLASQNIFEHMAQNASSTLQAVTPGEFTSNALEGAKGIFDLMQNFSIQGHGLNTNSTQMVASFKDAQTTATEVDNDTAEDFSDAQYDRMIEGLDAGTIKQVLGEIGAVTFVFSVAPKPAEGVKMLMRG